MTQQRDIIDELRRIRVESKMAQFDLSCATGYDRSQLARYETGKGAPRLQLVCDWAEALGYELVLKPK